MRPRTDALRTTNADPACRSQSPTNAVASVANEAHLGRQVLQRQTTLIALAAQEGGDQGFHGGSVTQWRENGSYDRVNSYGVAIFFAMPSVLGVGMTYSGAVWGRSQIRM
ncbi:MAG: hypothetical protein EB072_15600 [Betaproteobacteria bacterium]|nr:hypothetical protein [Betaproteobacteria bacterium]